MFLFTCTDTLIAGPLRIYRAPGSVAFLSCSSALKPILPKSQCWVVDDESGKFVLQIRPPQYWRIEVPNTSDIEKVQIEELKDVLGKVLQFEKTPCPFQRNFTVELPASPATPIKKRPWKPLARPKLDVSPLSKAEDASFLASEDGDISPSTRHPKPPTHTPSTPLPRGDHESNEVKAWAESLALEVHEYPENQSIGEIERPLQELKLSETSIVTDQHDRFNNALAPSTEISTDESISRHHVELDDEHSFSDSTDDTNATPRNTLQPAFQPVTVEPAKEAYSQKLQHCSRSITAPPVLSLVTGPPSKIRTKSPLRTSVTADSDSGFSSSVESFHTVQSWHSPLAPPSPPSSAPSSPTSMYPYPHDNIVLPKRVEQRRDLSEITATPDTPQCWEMSPIPDLEGSISTSPRTPTLTEDNKSEDERFEVDTPPTTIRSKVRHRATTSSNSHRRELSPLPAAVNLFSPKRRSRRLQTQRHLPTAIIQKTCEILLSPPSHLFQLMLNIASKIAAGEWRGVLSGYGESVHWDFEDEYSGDAWTEDDYGISLPSQNATSSASRTQKNVPGGSWEVD